MSRLNRVAIIIESSNVAGQTDLPGARKDATNWHNFLLSHLGGAWGENEIKVLHKPTVTLAQAYLSAHSHEYIFLVFSGHGFYEQGTTKICLNDTETAVPIVDISPRYFSTCIFDCCRGTDDGELPGSQESLNEGTRFNFGKMAVFDQHYRICNSRDDIDFQKLHNRHACAFLEGLDKIPASRRERLTMYACNIGEGASEFKSNNPENGGYYSTFLMRGAKKWQEREQSRQSLMLTYWTKEAHAYASAEIARRTPQQHPQYTPWYANYPFAIC